MLTKVVLLQFPENGVINKKYFLPRSPEILYATTKGFQIPVGNEIASNFSLNGATMAPITTTQLKNFLITLCDDQGTEYYKDLVPYSFTVLNNNGIFRDFMNHKIDTSRSYVKFQDVTGITTQSFIQFNFFVNP